MKKKLKIIKSIPAEFAKMPIYKAVYARIQNDPGDDMMKSSFTAEMTEIAYILHHVKEVKETVATIGGGGAIERQKQQRKLPELILIDELGRGSSVADGLAISLAITDWLVRFPLSEKLVTTFMSTHFHDLAKAMGARPGVSLINMKVDVSNFVFVSFFFFCSLP